MNYIFEQLRFCCPKCMFLNLVSSISWFTPLEAILHYILLICCRLEHILLDCVPSPYCKWIYITIFHCKHSLWASYALATIEAKPRNLMILATCRNMEHKMNNVPASTANILFRKKHTPEYLHNRKHTCSFNYMKIM